MLQGKSHETSHPPQAMQYAIVKSALMYIDEFARIQYPRINNSGLTVFTNVECSCAWDGHAREKTGAFAIVRSRGCEWTTPTLQGHIRGSCSHRSCLIKPHCSFQAAKRKFTADPVGQWHLCTPLSLQSEALTAAGLWCHRLGESHALGSCASLSRAQSRKGLRGLRDRSRPPPGPWPAGPRIPGHFPVSTWSCTCVIGRQHSCVGS